VVVTSKNDTGAEHGTDRDWWIVAGMAVAATSAALARFTGLRGLAELTGWPDRLAWLLPVTVDAYAMTATRVWLTSSSRSPAARRFARANATGAIAASVAGNTFYHAVQTGLLDVTWPMIVTVGAVPAVVLGLTAHLHAIRSRPNSPGRVPASADPGPEAVPSPDSDDARPRSQSRPPRRPRRPRYRSDEALFAAALEADARHRTERGKQISRDALRTELRIGGPRASDLHRRLIAHLDTTDPFPVPDREENSTPR
jgi:hypothetical protein